MTARPSRRILGSAVFAGALLLATGCSTPGSSSTSPSTSAKPTAAIATNPASAGQVTLRVWDQEVRGGQNAEITQLNKEFMAKYPNVTIQRTSKSFSDLKTTLKLALSGNNPPDVVEVNQGYPDMVSFVKAGMLLPLDSYASVYGWANRYPASLLNLNRVSADATHFGEGKLYGVSQRASTSASTTTRPSSRRSACSRRRPGRTSPPTWRRPRRPASSRSSSATSTSSPRSTPSA